MNIVAHTVGGTPRNGNFKKKVTKRASFYKTEDQGEPAESSPKAIDTNMASTANFNIGQNRSVTKKKPVSEFEKIKNLLNKIQEKKEYLKLLDMNKNTKNDDKVYE